MDRELVLFKLLQAVNESLPTADYEDGIEIQGSISDVLYFDSFPKEYRNRQYIDYAIHPKKLVVSAKTFKPEDFPIQAATCKVSKYIVSINNDKVECWVAISYQSAPYKQSCPEVLLYSF